MSQTNIIFGVLALAFVVFVVMRGEGPQYLDLFRHAKQSPPSGGGFDLASFAGDAATAAQFIAVA